MARYWYRIDHWECPLCGAGPTYRFRVYEEDLRGHYIFNHYDYCNV